MKCKRNFKKLRKYFQHVAGRILTIGVCITLKMIVHKTNFLNEMVKEIFSPRKTNSTFSHHFLKDRRR
jgi:hypothetical protein